MTATEIDHYLDGLDEPRRATLVALRRTILEVIPEAEQGIAYGAPAFRIAGTTVAGFSAAKQHLSYLPHSGAIVGSLTVEELAGFSATKGAVKMPVGTPLPASLVRRLIELRRTEAGV